MLHIPPPALASARLVLALLLATAFAAAPAAAAPIPGSAYDSGDGDQANSIGLLDDWQAARAAGATSSVIDPSNPDVCFGTGSKETAPRDWAFATSTGGCSPGKSDLLAAWSNAEPTADTTFSHLAFWRKESSGNTYLTFELNQSSDTWINPSGSRIPCRSDGDVLVSYEMGGGSGANQRIYRWAGDGTGPSSCPNGAAGTFTDSGPIAASKAQAAMNASDTPITNFLEASLAATFAKDTFGEGGVNLPAVLSDMGASPCFGFVRMSAHSRSSSSISASLTDLTDSIPVTLSSCAATGTVYRDVDHDGTRGVAEDGAAGVVAYVDYNGNAALDAGEPTATTDRDGRYQILGVSAGAGSVRLVLPTDTNCTAPSPCFYSHTFSARGNRTGNDFGIVAPGRIGGTIYEDADADGSHDGGEAGIAGVTVFADGDGDGELGPGELSDVTDTDGAYLLGQFAPSTVTVVAQLPQGYSCSGGCSAAAILTTGTTTVDIGGWRPAKASGTVWNDLDRDGVHGAGEPGIAGRTVYVDADHDGELGGDDPSTTTAADGTYSIGGLTPGLAPVRVAPSAHWTCATGCEPLPFLTSGQDWADGDFGLLRDATVSGSVREEDTEAGVPGAIVWSDTDGDGVRDAGEPQVATASGGTFTLVDVPAGTATLRVQLPTGWTCSAPSTCSYEVEAQPGHGHGSHAFVAWRPSTVTGVVFDDHDGDGVRDAGEPARSGVPVYADLDDDGSAGAAEPKTDSAGNGTYSLAGLRPGAQVLRVAAPSGWNCSGGSCRYAVTTTSNGTSTRDVGLRPTSGPAAQPVSSTGIGTATQTVTVTVPAGGSVTLLDSAGSPVTSVTVPGQGTYTLNPATGQITFAPVLGFAGDGTPVPYRVTDVFGNTAQSTYTPHVDPPAGPGAASPTTSGMQDTTQSTTVAIPANGSIALVGPDGQPTTTVTVPGGVYTLDPATGVITFTPNAKYSGVPTPVTYVVTDPYGQKATGTYAPTVLKKACASRRVMTMNWKAPRGVRIARQWMTIDGKRVGRLKATDRRAPVDMRGRSASRVKVEIHAISTAGKRYRTGRVYRTCGIKAAAVKLKTMKLRPVRS